MSSNSRKLIEQAQKLWMQFTATEDHEQFWQQYRKLIDQAKQQNSHIQAVNDVIPPKSALSNHPKQQTVASKKNKIVVASKLLALGILLCLAVVFIKAQLNVKRLYGKIGGVDVRIKTRSFNALIEKYTRKAEAGDAQAQYILANLYETPKFNIVSRLPKGNESVPPKEVLKNTQIDSAAALKWYEKSAKAGYARAQFILAVRYIDLRDKDKTMEALYWLAQVRLKHPESLEEMQLDPGPLFYASKLSFRSNSATAARQAYQLFCKELKIDSQLQSSVWSEPVAQQQDALGYDLCLRDWRKKGTTSDTPRRKQIEFWISKSAAKGNLKSQLALAKNMHPQLAKKIYQKAANQGDNEAQLKLGEILLKYSKDTLGALRWLHKSALQGNLEAENIMSNLYTSNHSKSNSPGKILNDSLLHQLHRYRGRSSQQSKSTQYIPKGLDELYQVLWLLKTQEGIESNKNLLSWIETTIQQTGSVSAMYHLSNIYRQSNNDSLVNKGNHLLEKSALGGLAIAQNDWAILLKNKQKKKEFLELSAQQGLMTAKHNLAMVYLEERQTDKAFKLIEECAKQGMPISQVHLGLLYFFGAGTAKDKTKAEDLIKKACSKSVLPAQIQSKLLRNLRLIQK